MPEEMSQELIHQALNQIEELRDNNWKNIDWEYEDKNTVLFRVHVTELSDEEADKKYCSKLQEKLTPLFKNNEKLSWMVVFIKNGDVIASAFTL